MFLMFAAFASVSQLLAQSKPLVIAWQAPSCKEGDQLCTSNLTYAKAFVSNELPYVSGIGAVVPWSSIDACSSGGVSQPCTTDVAGCADTTKDYQWCDFDNGLMYYIKQAGFAGKKIVLIVYPENDSPEVNTYTPQYVFSSNWATQVGTQLGYTVQPQDVSVCNGWQGDVPSGNAPVTLKTGDSFQSTDYAIWNLNNCFVFNSATSDLQCTGTPPYSDFSGFPIVYEKPILMAYQNFISELVFHYTNSLGAGYSIGPYIAYVRVGMSSGGEDVPYCATQGRLSAASWLPLEVVQPGFVVNTGSAYYVATGGGITGASSMPTCSPAGCTTATDGTVPGWYQADNKSAGSASNAIWPGPAGQFGGGAEPQGFSDNGYLPSWGGFNGSGYIATMTNFLNNLGAPFPFDIAAHFGPPSNQSVYYADSEAIIASKSDVGFGMQSTNVGDSISFAAGIFPTSREDWAHNFASYPAPVHHLQMNAPGSMYFWEGYTINYIDVGSGEATVYCSFDCSPFSGQEIYIAGNSNPALNGVWLVNCSGAMGACLTGQLQFAFTPSCTNPCGTGGTVWGPEYWPIVMPFDVQRGSTSIEVWECSLDYAFNTQTTYWSSSDTDPNSGCAGTLYDSSTVWGVPPPTSTGDPSYQSTLSNALNGQPSSTNAIAGQATFYNGYQH
jgi:hypothetical protein